MTESIIDIAHKDLSRGADTLAQAFQGDPLFTYIFGTPQHYDRVAPWMLSTWIRWCINYGKAWATPEFEAVALRRLPGHYHMSMWSLLRAGMLATPIKLGWASFRRLDQVVRLMEEEHKAILGKQLYWYCQTLGVVPAQQGKGFGRSLMQHTFALADAGQLPCYLETTMERNVEIHRRQGYVVRKVVEVPASELRLIIMVRPPRV